MDAQEILEQIGLTSQQINLATAISKLQRENTATNASAIAKKYFQLFGKQIQRPNLFVQLKKMQDSGILAKKEKFYFVSVENAHALLRKKIAQKESELGKLEKAVPLIDNYFSKGEEKKQEARFVYFQTHEEYFAELAKRLSRSDAVYFSSIFPGICFTPALIKFSGAPEYFSFIQKACNENLLEFHYMSEFNTAYLNKIAVEARKNKNSAYNECLLAMDNLRQQLKTCKNLHVRALPYSLGLFFGIPEKNGMAKECFIFTKTADDRLGGGVLIESEEMANDLKALFHRESKNAINLRKNKHTIESIKRKFITYL